MSRRVAAACVSAALIAILAAWVLVQAAPVRAAPMPWPPLDMPVPTNVTLSDLLATSNPSGDGGGPLPGAQTCRSAPHRAVSLPADDGPHNSTAWEYWWWYGHLRAPDGRRFAYMFSPAARPWANYHGIDYALTDLASGTFHYGREPLVLGQPRATRSGPAIHGKHGAVAGTDGRFEIQFETDGYRVDLSLKPNKPPVLQGGPPADIYCLNLYHYQRPRMTTTGTVRYRGKTMRVTGASDFHHQWGFFPAEATGAFGWNILTFALRDGRDITLIDGSAPGHNKVFTAHSGIVSDARGRVSLLHRSDFTITPTRLWRRDSGCSYPVDWNVRIRTRKRWINLHAHASVDSAELRATRHPETYVLQTNFPAFWDGPTVVSGDASGLGWLDTGHYCTLG